MKKFAFLFNTRNCYQLFEEIFFKKSKCDFSDCYMFNVDIFSKEEQKNLGKSILEKYGIIDLTPQKDKHIASAARTLEVTFDYIEKNNLDIDWVIWQTQDTYIVRPNFLEKFSEISSRDEIKEKVGLVGFNNFGLPSIHENCFGRSNIVKNIMEYPHGGWYANLRKDYLSKEYFIVETPSDSSIAVNRKLYRKHIVSDYNFKLWYWADDISWQFLIQNIPSISVVDLLVNDDRRSKEDFGVSMAEKRDFNYHFDRDDDHQSKWKLKYGWWFAGWNAIDKTKIDVRADFLKNMRYPYRNSLIEKLYNWDLYDGPKSLEDIK